VRPTLAAHDSEKPPRKGTQAGRRPRSIALSALESYNNPFTRWAFALITEVTPPMRPEIHPSYKPVTITCSCGNRFETRSTLGSDLQVEVCSNCHPFYTGKQKIVDTGGRVDKFRRRYGAK
jgi:large subunit ribosomal protein L31